MDKIIIKGARENNLKNIDLELPKNKFIVMTGVSGSGKSSLAFDTIYQEGQRRFVESLSSFATSAIILRSSPAVIAPSCISSIVSIPFLYCAFSITQVWRFVKSFLGGITPRKFHPRRTLPVHRILPQ